MAVVCEELRRPWQWSKGGLLRELRRPLPWSKGGLLWRSAVFLGRKAAIIFPPDHVADKEAVQVLFGVHGDGGEPSGCVPGVVVVHSGQHLRIRLRFFISVWGPLCKLQGLLCNFFFSVVSLCKKCCQAYPIISGVIGTPLLFKNIKKCWPGLLCRNIVLGNVAHYLHFFIFLYTSQVAAGRDKIVTV